MSALDDLQAVMFKWKDRFSVIKPKLDCNGTGTGVRWWRLHLVEDFGSELANEFVNDHLHSINLDDCVNWTNDKLQDWPNCKRMAHDMWDFKHRRDAEKFITLFHLSWQQ
jgi:hypothetical protein